jgi:hypothetical protein
MIESEDKQNAPSHPGARFFVAFDASIKSDCPHRNKRWMTA